MSKLESDEESSRALRFVRGRVPKQITQQKAAVREIEDSFTSTAELLKPEDVVPDIAKKLTVKQEIGRGKLGFPQREDDGPDLPGSPSFRIFFQTSMVEVLEEDDSKDSSNSRFLCILHFLHNN
ncbi:hypothetical protein AXF42_Ash009569 [Apostasia shenzhenica]|uniref:Uncharacterized protein n=1 Tax=Apostasia shenzhenica TaxID=1088818 RepID=A0A2I0B978_9ASPA|nr:hypothetical protein AXF42_Ash009569 [Apostasia shenzhenica]